MNNKNRRVGHLVFIFSFLLILLFSNKIITIFREDNTLRKSDISEFDSKTITRSGIDFVYPSSNIFGTVQIIGWAFSETNEDNSNKFVQLVLNSNDYNYISHRVDVRDRTDITATFRHTTSIKGNRHGFGISFDTFNIQDGLYDIFIFVWENENSYGIAKPGAKILIKNGKAYEYSLKQVDTSSFVINQANRMNGAIDSLQIENGKVKADGWLFAEGIQSDSQRVIIEFINKSGDKIAFETFSINRDDIANFFGSEYKESGFSLSFDESDLVIGEYSIILYIESNGKLYPFENIFTGNYMKEGVISLVDTEGDLFSSANTEEINQQILNGAVIEKDLRFAIDRCIRIAGSIRIDGWVANTGITNPDFVNYVSISNKEGKVRLYECLRIERMDIVSAFSNNNLKESGILARIPIDIQVNDEYTLKFYQVSSDGYVAEAENVYKFRVVDYRLVLE